MKRKNAQTTKDDGKHACFVCKSPKPLTPWSDRDGIRAMRLCANCERDVPLGMRILWWGILDALYDELRQRKAAGDHAAVESLERLRAIIAGAARMARNDDVNLVKLLRRKTSV